MSIVITTGHSSKWGIKKKGGFGKAKYNLVREDGEKFQTHPYYDSDDTEALTFDKSQVRELGPSEFLIITDEFVSEKRLDRMGLIDGADLSCKGKGGEKAEYLGTDRKGKTFDFAGDKTLEFEHEIGRPWTRGYNHYYNTKMLALTKKQQDDLDLSLNPDKMSTDRAYTALWVCPDGVTKVHDIVFVEGGFVSLTDCRAYKGGDMSNGTNFYRVDQAINLEDPINPGAIYVVHEGAVCKLSDIHNPAKHTQKFVEPPRSFATVETMGDQQIFCAKDEKGWGIFTADGKCYCEIDNSALKEGETPFVRGTISPNQKWVPIWINDGKTGSKATFVNRETGEILPHRFDDVRDLGTISDTCKKSNWKAVNIEEDKVGFGSEHGSCELFNVETGKFSSLGRVRLSDGGYTWPLHITNMAGVKVGEITEEGLIAFPPRGTHIEVSETFEGSKNPRSRVSLAQYKGANNGITKHPRMGLIHKVGQEEYEVRQFGDKNYPDVYTALADDPTLFKELNTEYALDKKAVEACKQGVLRMVGDGATQEDCDKIIGEVATKIEEEKKKKAENTKDNKKATEETRKNVADKMDKLAKKL